MDLVNDGAQIFVARWCFGRGSHRQDVTPGDRSPSGRHPDHGAPRDPGVLRSWRSVVLPASQSRMAPAVRARTSTPTSPMRKCVKCALSRRRRPRSSATTAPPSFSTTRAATAKDPADDTIVVELASLIEQLAPTVVYTHNLADRHDTHVAVASPHHRSHSARSHSARPEAVYGCEVWRDLDWMTAEDKVAFDVSDRPNLAAALIGVYDSQISGGKRYDLATAGRRLANATFSESHSVDVTQALIYAMDLTPLVTSESLTLRTFVSRHIERMSQEISSRIGRLT